MRTSVNKEEFLEKVVEVARYIHHKSTAAHKHLVVHVRGIPARCPPQETYNPAIELITKAFDGVDQITRRGVIHALEKIKMETPKQQTNSLKLTQEQHRELFNSRAIHMYAIYTLREACGAFFGADIKRANFSSGGNASKTAMAAVKKLIAQHPHERPAELAERIDNLVIELGKLADAISAQDIARPRGGGYRGR